MPEPGENIHKGHRSRVRQRYLTQGLEGFQPHEALELLLFFAIPQADTNALAHRLIDEFGSLDAVFSALPEELMRVSGVGENTAVLLSMLRPALNLAARSRPQESPVLKTHRDMIRYCLGLPFSAGQETFYLICMNAQWRVLRALPLFQGTIDAVSVHMRVIVETALRFKAYSVLVVHNHPSEKPEPSAADIEVTQMIQTALGAVDIPLIDHVIVSPGKAFSIRREMELREKLVQIDCDHQKQAADREASRRKKASVLREDMKPFEE